jgi:amino-acid N-acetyltransferase
MPDFDLPLDQLRQYCPEPNAPADLAQFWDRTLAEIRSIPVALGEQRRGGGSRLVKALLAQAKKHRVSCICLFTRTPQFFARMGFAIVERSHLPDKIYKDCCLCRRSHSCDEVAMVRGELPTFAILPGPPNWLVKLQV